jgi:hypothetical protein
VAIILQSRAFLKEGIVMEKLIIEIGQEMINLLNKTEKENNYD